MLCTIKGKITRIEKNSIVVETCGLGFEVFVSKPKSYSLNEEVSLDLYHHKREDNEFLVGFNDKNEKEAFKYLIRVNGLGPKGAITILSKMTYGQLLNAISENNARLIETTSGISPRIAMQIVIDLKDYLRKQIREHSDLYSEVRDALKKLKFKVKEIDKILPLIYSETMSKEDILREALRRLQNVKNIWL